MEPIYLVSLKTKLSLKIELKTCPRVNRKTKRVKNMLFTLFYILMASLSTEFNKILGLMWFSLRFIISYKPVTNSPPKYKNAEM